MSTLRNVAIAVLSISAFVFVAFFGRIPALRNTPIGYLNRLLWIHLPNGLFRIDRWLTGGRVSSSTARFAHILWNDRHPTVMIFFILLLSVSEYLFLPQAWSLMSTSRKIKAVLVLSLPYIFLYAAAASDPGYITPSNHSKSMALYPYDFTIFHPGQSCSTCKHLKPARSKHCSICKHCISKFDHHCIFINNCVSYGNHHWFLLLLLSTAVLTTYACYVGISLLSAMVLERIPSWTLSGTGFTWSQYWNILAWALQEKTRMGGVTMLCFLTSPLVWGLLGYHLYLVWAGTTTNESMKWSDWAEEMLDGFVFKRALSPTRQKDLSIEPARTRWIAESQQIVLRTDDGMAPRNFDEGVGEWERVWKLADIENLYDLGFWRNLKDIFISR